MREAMMTRKRKPEDWLSVVTGVLVCSSLAACTPPPPKGNTRRAVETSFVSLKEVPIPAPTAIVIPAPITNIPGPGTDLDFKDLGAAGIVKDQAALVRLGKALFWDMQVGSDGVQACATCHYNAGADVRSRNQTSPGLKDTNWTMFNPPVGIGGDNKFGNSTVPYTANDPRNPSGPKEPPAPATNVPGLPQLGPNSKLTARDFPHNDWFIPTQLTPRPFDIFGSGQVVTVAEEFANVSRDTNDVTSSQGVRRTKFVGVVPGQSVDKGEPLPDIYNLATPGKLSLDKRVRRVEPRNAPTMINAVFNLDNFWDGRASYIFNGVNPFGFRDRESTLKRNVGGQLIDVFVRVTNSSLASQSVGPPTSDFEMSYDGRTFPDVGKKLLGLRPLAKQYVHPDDSVLGPWSAADPYRRRNGLAIATYADMIKAAFQSSWWDSSETLEIDPAGVVRKRPSVDDPGCVWLSHGKSRLVKRSPGWDLGADDYTQMMYNFSLFFGLAVQAYEATLVSNDTPFDRYMGAPSRGIPGDFKALNAKEQVGLNMFMGAGRCADCHVPPITTGFTILDTQPSRQGVPLGSDGIIEFMQMGDGQTANYDHGMYNIGMRRTTEDIGRGATAPDASPFRNPLDNGQLFPLSYVELSALRDAGKLPPDVARFVPDLHGQSLPRHVTQGAFKVPNLRNVEFTGPYFHAGDSATLRQVVEFYTRGGNFPATNFANLTVNVEGIPEMMSPETSSSAKANIEGLVAFLSHGLTDQRVAYERAPFDHPELVIPNGSPDHNPDADLTIDIPATGRHGRATPIAHFLGLNPQTP